MTPTTDALSREDRIAIAVCYLIPHESRKFMKKIRVIPDGLDYGLVPSQWPEAVSFNQWRGGTDNMTRDEELHEAQTWLSLAGLPVGEVVA